MALKTITLSSDQVTLLGQLMAAAEAMPDKPEFQCGRLLRVGFAWIIHDGFHKDVRVANWDDVLALESYGLIELHLGDDPNDCMFVITELARQVEAPYDEAARAGDGMVLSIGEQTAGTG